MLKGNNKVPSKSAPWSLPLSQRADTVRHEPSKDQARKDASHRSRRQATEEQLPSGKKKIVPPHSSEVPNDRYRDKQEQIIGRKRATREELGNVWIVKTPKRNGKEETAIMKDHLAPLQVGFKHRLISFGVKFQEATSDAEVDKILKKYKWNYSRQCTNNRK